MHYHPRYLERPLKAHGFSVSARPHGRGSAIELVITVWPKRGVGGVEKARRDASDAWVLSDETGHSFRIRPGTTWAWRG